MDYNRRKNATKGLLRKVKMLQSGKFNVVVDGQFGSTGKGKIAAYLAKTYRPQFISTTNGPNAGHVSVCGDRKFLSKILPASAIHDEEIKPKYVIGAGAIFGIDRLLEEISTTGVDREFSPVSVSMKCGKRDYGNDELPSGMAWIKLHRSALVVEDDGKSTLWGLLPTSKGKHVGEFVSKGGKAWISSLE